MSFKFSSVGHAIAVGLSDVKKAAVAVEDLAARMEPALQKAQPIADEVTQVVAAATNKPGLVTLERAMFDLAGRTGQVILEGGAAAVQKGVNVPLDAEFVNDFMDLLKLFKNELAGNGVQVPA